MRLHDNYVFPFSWETIAYPPTPFYPCKMSKLSKTSNSAMPAAPSAPSSVPSPNAGLTPEAKAARKAAALLCPGKSGKAATAQSYDGAFEGSFAGTARMQEEVYILPWYRRREYFLGGWTDARIWRAAVRCHSLPIRARPPDCLTRHAAVSS